MSSDDRSQVKNAVQIRVFGSLYEFAAEHNWPTPLEVDLKEECSATKLAESVGIPVDKIEGVFIDGKASPIDEGRIKPGSRVGFIPYDAPGPGLMLGYHRPQGSQGSLRP